MPKISVVVPIYNESANIPPLLSAIKGALSSYSYEIILVDDGSADDSVAVAMQHADENTQIIKFARNFGQTSAMAAGIESANGEYIATLDGDMQNDPADIPMMIEMLEAHGLDVVAGQRQKRQDGMILRKIPSKIANYIIRASTGVKISDYGCTLKLFRADIAKKLELYGELHRFIPILGKMYGAKIAEVPVRHHPRLHGTSKYGIGRTVKVISDLMLMLFFLKYRQKPMHLFGGIGIGMFALGSLIELYLLIEKISGNDIGQRPLFYVGILLLIMSVQFITAGFLSELMMRTYFESQNKKPYVIAEKIRGKKS